MNAQLTLKTVETDSNQAPSSQIITEYDSQYQLEWCYMNPKPRPCFNFDMMREFHALYGRIHTANPAEQIHNVRYQVLASNTPGIFNLGGDLELFKKLVVKKDRDTLLQYATVCVDAIYARSTSYKKNVTQISLVQGDALGGGFEAAIAADVVIAEKSAKFGLPEVLFNTFPGMGAYTFLSRKIGPAMTERMILSGKLYNAEELYDMGVVDMLAEDGQGEMAVFNYIAKENRCENSINAIRNVRNLHYPVTYDQLLETTSMWVDTVLNLTTRDLRMIERLIAKQNARSAAAA